MQKLMLGNEAVARGLFEAGVRFVSAYPGTPSTEITEEAVKFDGIYCEWAPNEKVATEAAFGASLAGARSACCMKHVGLNVAADPVFTASYTGVNAGLLICVADDPGMHSSQNEQDSRYYARAAKLPMLEPSDSQEAKDFAKAALSLSEEFDTPFMLRMVTRIAHSQSAVETQEPEDIALKTYEKNPRKYIMSPANAIVRHPLVEERMRKLQEFSETSGFNRMEDGLDNSLGIITSGTCYQYVKEVLGDSVPVLKLGMVNPLPKNKIRSFAETVQRLVVVEELDGFIQEQILGMGIACEGKNLFTNIGELSQTAVAKAFGLETGEHIEALSVPGRPPIMCAGCPHRGLFYVLAKNKLRVLGDIGCYTLGAAAPLNASDMTLCMGASVSALHGFKKVRSGKDEPGTVCVIGDSTFMHSGMTGLANIAYNNSDGTVIILDNSITGMTGHQNNPTNGKNIKGEPATKIDLESLCRALGIERVTVVDPYDLAATEEAIKKEIQSEGPGVIISRRPCALLKNVKHGVPLKIDAEKCKNCRACMRIGCPSISIREGKPFIDENMCTGCGICAELCKFDALKKGAEA